MRTNRFLILLFLCATAHASEPVTSDRGLFQLRYTSSIEPVVINQMHSWELLLTSADGDVVEGAEFDVAGGMPVHDHGLATVPRVTEDLGGGRYRLDGLRFHMAGEWQLDFEIRADGYTDSVTVILTL